MILKNLILVFQIIGSLFYFFSIFIALDNMLIRSTVIGLYHFKLLAIPSSLLSALILIPLIFKKDRYLGFCFSLVVAAALVLLTQILYNLESWAGIFFFLSLPLYGICFLVFLRWLLEN